MSVVDFWNEHWNSRCTEEGGITCNLGKAKRIITELWERPALIKAKILEIGCGPAIHIRNLRSVCPGWGSDYLGIDLSGRAVREAVNAGINAKVADICSFTSENGEKFDAFFLFDTLEHVEDHAGLAGALSRLASDNAVLLGNVPLFLTDQSKDGGYERQIDIQVLQKFILKTPFKYLHYDVYGIGGWPFMWFEARTWKESANA